MTLAYNIRYLRRKQGWSQDDLAERLGYKSYTTIQKWESGVSQPPLKIAHALADLFHVDIDDLTKKELWQEELAAGSPISTEEAPAPVAEDGRLSELIELASQLPENQLEMLIAQIKGLLAAAKSDPAAEEEAAETNQ